MILVGSLELPFSNLKVGSIRFMEYQKEAIEKEEKIVAVKAPTGAGKTLAMLKKALDVTDKGCTAIFLYPTNELLFDQYVSFVNLLKAMDCKIGFVRFEDSSEDLKIDKADILVFPVNGQYLEHLSKGRAKGYVLREVLNSPEVVDSKLLILSNIDFLYNLVKGCYFRSELTLPDIVKTLAFIAVDELHMYWGTTFLSLLFLLRSLEKVNSIMISGATHTATLKTLFESLSSSRVVVDALKSMSQNESVRIVRHETFLRIGTFGDDPYMSTREHLSLVVKEVKNLLEECDTLLCIFNSVIFAEKVAKELENFEEVGRIHGFIPKGVREEMRDKRIVVGTSSIEVGVDFDREGLLFEANNAPSFLQRFGRVGRHRNGKAVALLPFYEWKVLNKAVSKFMPFQEFEKIVWKKLETPRDYSEIKNSCAGASLYLSYIASLLSLIKRTYGYKSEKAAMLEKARVVLEKLEKTAKSEVHNPKIDESILNNVLQKVKRKAILGAFCLLEISSVFPRGGMPSVPVFFEEFGEFELMSIDNLEKTELKLVKAEEIEKEKPRWLKAMGNVPIFVVEDVNFNNYLKIIVMTNSNDVFILCRDKNKFKSNKSEFKVLSNWEEEVNLFIENLFDGLPAYFTRKVPDWRFSWLRAKKGKNRGYIVIGGDAYICREIDSM